MGAQVHTRASIFRRIFVEYLCGCEQENCPELLVARCLPPFLRGSFACLSKFEYKCKCRVIEGHHLKLDNHVQDL